MIKKTSYEQLKKTSDVCQLSIEQLIAKLNRLKGVSYKYCSETKLLKINDTISYDVEKLNWTDHSVVGFGFESLLSHMLKSYDYITQEKEISIIEQ